MSWPTAPRHPQNSGRSPHDFARKRVRAPLCSRPMKTAPGWLLVLCLTASFAPAATVTGRVFHDRNRDGLASAQEPGLADVVVSDGRSVVTTTATGEYRIDAAEGAPFVFVVLPRGFRAHAHKFYHDARTAGPKEFALVDWPESRADTIRLVQISDTHVTAARDTVQTFAEDAREINALAPKAAFVIATGDLVDRGALTPQFDGYLEAIAHFELPLFNLPGNHDTNTKEGLEHYHRYLGPDCYSFNAGGCHFVLLDYLRYRDQSVQEWVRRDLAAAPKGATVVFAMHALPTEEQLTYFASVGAKAVLSGHWHGNRVREAGGLFDLNTPPMRFGGIDRHPRGFRVIEIAGGQVKNELRLGGFKHHATIVSPAGPAEAPGGRLPIVVNAYDSRVEIAGVECEIGGQRVALRRTSPWNWAGEAAVPAAGRGRMVARIRAANGETWRAESDFQLRAPADSPLRLKWVAPTGGIVGLSTPQVTRDGVVVGLDDQGDLAHCGVAMFGHDGRKRWHFRTDSAIKNSVAAADGRVFATSVAGTLYAIDASTGRRLWDAGLDRARQQRWEVTGTTVSGGTVYAGSYLYIAAFDAATGQRRWDLRPPAGTDWAPRSYAVPVVTGDRVLLSNLRYASHALVAATGAVAWKLEGAVSGFAVDGRTVFALKENVPVALSLDDGSVRWTGKTKVAASASRPVLAGDRIIIGAADGRVCALSTKDGAVIWSAQTGSALTSLEPYKRGGSDVNSSPAVSGNVVYVGASDGHVHALALGDGRKLGSWNLGVPIGSSPAIAGHTLYIGGYDGNLYAFALASAAGGTNE